MAYYWRCYKCGRTTVENHKPLNGNCSKGGAHSWSKKLDKAVKWRCSKCGRVTGDCYKPLKGNCSKGGGHSWSKY